MLIYLVSSPQLLLDTLLDVRREFLIVCEKRLLLILHGNKDPIDIFPHILTSQLANKNKSFSSFLLTFYYGILV